MANVFTDQSSDIDLYTKSQSRNGAKIAILLEELGFTLDLPLSHTLLTLSHRLPYRVHKVDTAKNAHREA